MFKSKYKKYYPWFDVNLVGRLQIETSNYCNAACPQCPRYTTSKDLLNTTTHTLENYKKWLGHYKWDNLNQVHFCGSIDEPTTNPELIDICKWFINLGPKVNEILISTNGGTRDKTFWEALGKLSNDTQKVRVLWGIDGLEDTNHLYRRNVKWKTLQSNFRTYIKSGGYASWQFIVFDHNKHQLESVKERVEQEGFKNLELIQSYRPTVDGVSTVDSVTIPEWYNTDYGSKIDGESSKDLVDKNKKLKKVGCPAKLKSKKTTFHPTHGNIFINVDGYVVPCCWMGDPDTLNDLWEEHHTIDKKLHNLHHTNLQDIINGYWKHIHNKMQTYPLCVDKCKNLNNSFNL